MKKLVVVCLSIVFTQSCFSQNQWSIGLSIQPGIGGISNPKLLEGFGENVTDIKTGNEGTFSVKTILDYRVSKKIRINSGIGFLKDGFSWRYGRDYYNMEEMEAIFPELVNWNYTTVTTKYYSFQIPLGIKYDIVNSKRFGLYLNTGASVIYLFDGSWKTQAEFTNKVVNESTNQNPSEDSKLLIGTQIGIGLSFNITSNSTFFVEPCYHHNIVKVKNTFPLDGNLYNFGVNIGVIFSRI